MSKFKRKLGSLNEKIKERERVVWHVLISIIVLSSLLFAVPIIVRQYLPPLLYSILYIILMLVLFVAWSVYWFRTASKIDMLNLTDKEKTLFNLYYALEHLRNYKQKKDPKQFKNLRKSLDKTLKIISSLYFNLFGTTWESQANSFFYELKLYLDIEILPKLKMSATDEKLNEIYSQLEKIFCSLYSDDYGALKDELKEVNEKYKKQKKSFLERHKINKQVLVQLFGALTIIILTFLAYWMFSEMFDFEFSFTMGVSLSLALPTAIFAGMQIVKTVKGAISK